MKCTKCEVDQPEDNFSWRKKNVKRTSMCKTCHNAIAKSHYKNNKQYYKDKSIANRRRYAPRGKAFVIEYLQEHPCVDCGEDDIEVLEFDHVEELKNYKSPRVTSLFGQSIARILLEIDKCDVRCSNCHTRRTRRISGTLRMPE